MKLRGAFSPTIAGSVSRRIPWTGRLLLAILFATLLPVSVFAQYEGHIGVYADVGGTDCDIPTPLGEHVSFHVVFWPPAEGARVVQFAAPLPHSGLYYVSETCSQSTCIGDSQTGIQVTFSECLTGPIHVLTITAFVTHFVPLCTPYPVIPHPAAGGEIEWLDCDWVGGHFATSSVAVLTPDVSCPCGMPGTVEIDPEPNSLNAPWSLSGPTGTVPGTGDETLTNMLPGEYTLTWQDTPGWITPDPDSVVQELPPDEYITFSGTYQEPLAGLNAGLIGVADGSVAWGDYDDDGDLDLVLTGDSGAGYVASVYRNDSGDFNDIGAGLAGVRLSSSAWGDYDNDGDLDLLLAGYEGYATYVSKIYRNDGGGTFTDVGAGLIGTDSGSVAWGDFDNDGDLDIALTGTTLIGPPNEWPPVSRVYRNDAGSFTDIGSALLQVTHSALAWGDYDNDSDLDLVLTGQSAGGSVALVYRNDAGSLNDTGAGLPGVTDGSVAWGDYDNDGDLDLLLTGDSGADTVAIVYRNDAGSFNDSGAGLMGVTEGSAVWGDHDNDGDLDILLTGETGSGYVANVYCNDAASFIITTELTGLSHSAAAWGDCDDDGDLDLALSGDTGTGAMAEIYQNIWPTPNTLPSAPTNLTAQVIGSTMTMSWDAATDAETPATGLTYNLRVGTTPGGEEICPAMADAATGHRRVAALGNANHDTSWTLELPSPVPSNIYWSVQAVDGCFAGSEFASNQATGQPAVNTLPTAYALHPGAPNPFGWRTTLRFDLPRAGQTRLEIFDVTGRRVRMLVDGAMEPGWYTPVWDGRDTLGRPVSSGVYFVRFESGDFHATQKVVRTR